MPKILILTKGITTLTPFLKLLPTQAGKAVGAKQGILRIRTGAHEHSAV